LRIEDFVTSRDERFRFYESLNRARTVHILGTATTLLSRGTINLSLDDFRMRNAADLQLAIAAQRQRVPMVALARYANWITEERPWTAEGFSIWKTTKERGHSGVQTHLARAAVSDWQLHKDPLEEKTAKVSKVSEGTPLFAESVASGGFDKCVEELNAKLSGELFFVVVGAMDGVNHDRLRKHIARNKNWQGLLVEPLPDMFDKLKANYAGRSNLLFEDAAITEQEGTAEITRIPEENVDNECPSWADGISTLRPDIHIIGQREELKEFSVKQSIRTTTFESLARKHSLKQIDILQIDAEGYDKEIFDQVWEANFRPSIIKVEVNYLTYVAIKELKAKLETYNYKCFFERDDLVAAKA
jgi:FkbM family methyltransferase